MLQVVRRLFHRTRSPAALEVGARAQTGERIFHRPRLAQDMACELMSRHFASGMFLTAPRRTGKTTFIREDLIPVLERACDALVLYVDLWERRSEDPGAAIVDLVEHALKLQEQVPVGWLKRLSVARLKAPGVEIEVAKAPQRRPLSLRECLERLALLSRKTVVLIVDEAQHTQSTQYGRDVLFMLKSARDQLNHRDDLKFRVVMTGSHHVKIERLVRHKHEAFYCAPLKVLPTLGDADYLAWARAMHGEGFRPELLAMEQAFETCLRRPEVFHGVCKTVAMSGDLAVDEQERLLQVKAKELIASERRDFLSRLSKVGAMDQALLRVMAEQGKGFQPYFPDAAKRIRTLLADVPDAAGIDLSPDAIRAAFGRLQDAKFVWSGDGPYVFEESQCAAWLAEGEWSDLTRQVDAAQAA